MQIMLPVYSLHWAYAKWCVLSMLFLQSAICIFQSWHKVLVRKIERCYLQRWLNYGKCELHRIWLLEFYMGRQIAVCILRLMVNLCEHRILKWRKMNITGNKFIHKLLEFRCIWVSELFRFEKFSVELSWLFE